MFPIWSLLDQCFQVFDFRIITEVLFLFISDLFFIFYKFLLHWIWEDFLIFSKTLLTSSPKCWLEMTCWNDGSRSTCKTSWNTWLNWSAKTPQTWTFFLRLSWKPWRVTSKRKSSFWLFALFRFPEFRLFVVLTRFVSCSLPLINRPVESWRTASFCLSLATPFISEKALAHIREQVFSLKKATKDETTFDLLVKAFEALKRKLPEDKKVRTSGGQNDSLTDA